MIINGEKISGREQRELESLWKQAEREFAGEFHEMNRSEKFRNDWPDQDKFVEVEHKTFSAAVRLVLTKQLLPDSGKSEEEKHKIFKAIVMMDTKAQRNAAAGIEADTRLQLLPDTQQFVGDKYENKKIMERFGGARTARAFKRQILSSIAGEIEKL